MTAKPHWAEQYVRRQLEKERGTPFSKMRLIIGRNSRGEEVPHEFDLVSADLKIVGEVKSGKLGNDSTGLAGYNGKRKLSLIADLFFLERVEADEKILVLTNEELFEKFKQDMDGLLPKNMSIRYVSLP